MEDKFRLIPGGQRTLLVPHGQRAEQLREQILTAKQNNVPLPRPVFRLIQQFSVNIYAQEWDKLVPAQTEVLDADAGLYMLNNNQLYDSHIGLLRDVEDKLDNYIV